MEYEADPNVNFKNPHYMNYGVVDCRWIMLYVDERFCVPA